MDRPALNPRIELYTGARPEGVDAASFGATLNYRGHHRKFSGYLSQTNIKRANLYAVVATAEKITRPSRVCVHTASEYVFQWASRLSQRLDQPLPDGDFPDRDLWSKAQELMLRHEISWHQYGPDDRNHQQCLDLARVGCEFGQKLITDLLAEDDPPPSGTALFSLPETTRRKDKGPDPAGDAPGLFGGKAERL